MYKIFFLFLLIFSSSSRADVVVEHFPTMEEAWNGCASFISTWTSNLNHGQCLASGSVVNGTCRTDASNAYCGSIYAGHNDGVPNSCIDGVSTFDLVTNSCPVNCTAGEVAYKSSLYMTSDGTTPSINIGSSVKYSVDGCEYVQDSSISIPSVCNEAVNGDVFCNVSLISTGVGNVATNELEPVISNTNLVDSAGCITVNGIKSCPTSDHTDSCFFVNGLKTCLDSNSSTVVIDGESITDVDSKNCVQGSEGITCLATLNNPTSSLVLNDTVQSSTASLNNDVTNITETTVVTNQDNSVTTTITESTNVIDSNEHVTETVAQPDGSSVTTETDTAIENEVPDYIPPTGVDTSGVGTAIDAFFDSSESLLSASEFNENTNFLDFVLPDLSGSCSSLTMDFNVAGVPFVHVVNPCTKLAPFREIFGYFLYLITGLTLVYVVTKPSTM